jgi:hypothetical protein
MSSSVAPCRVSTTAMRRWMHAAGICLPCFCPWCPVTDFRARWRVARRMKRMDRVRFGRALGMGARAAARTAMEAVDAATAPSPAPSRSQNASQATSRPVSASRPTVLPPIGAAAARVMPAARAAASGVSGPFRTASRALWHELTGSFFALFALSFVVGAWHTRASAVSAIPNERYRFYAFCALALLFAYFSVSSFVRARRRD